MKRYAGLLWEAIIGSWLAWGLLWAYVAINAVNGPSVNVLWSGGLALATILLAMNSMARTGLWWTSRSPAWFRQHSVIAKFHHLSEEGELAGIAVGGVILYFLLSRGVHVHYAISEGLTLFGIMSAANLALKAMLPIMGGIERLTGKWGVIVLGSLVSSFTGEPAAAVFLPEHVKKRTPEKNRLLMATGLGASIGSGGGLLPFAAPPILIVWAILQHKFDWGLWDLFRFVGVACVLHVVTVAIFLRKHFHASEETEEHEEIEGHNHLASIASLLLLAGVVALNLTVEYHHQLHLTWVVNAMVGVLALVMAYWSDKSRKQEHEEAEHQGHDKRWQPLSLCFLLLVLEIVGLEAEPLLSFLASFIPSAMPLLAVALMLWYATAFTSHFADNALASRVFITVALSLAAARGEGHDLLALSVVLGAVFGGFILIPANLPNFAIAARMGVTPGEWAQTGWKWYPTGVVHIVWIVALYYLMA